MWQTAYASVIGTSHLKASIPCQDYCNFKAFKKGDKDVLIIGISDGAGSASNAKMGARIAVDNILSNIASSNIELPDFNESYAHDLLKKPAQLLSDIATENYMNIKELSCTLLVACLSSDSSVFFQVGDGAWVIKTTEGLKAATWPYTGEYANETKFITSPDACEYIQFNQIDEPILAVAGFTDGLQSLILDYSQKAPHAGFFEPVFETLFKTSENSNFSAYLEEFLNSQMVNHRTDDDKTIFFAWQG